MPPPSVGLGDASVLDGLTRTGLSSEGCTEVQLTSAATISNRKSKSFFTGYLGG
jgi:hypothetical protein